MQNNTTLSNRTQHYGGCNINHETLDTVSLYAHIAASICSFVGNLLVVLTVYRNKNLRTSTNYFIVSMSVSDILYQLFRLLSNKFILGMFSIQSNLVGNLLCKLLPFIIIVSVGVSALTLVVIAVIRFSAVMFPLLARVQNKRKLFLVLLLTWVIPIVVVCPALLNYKFNKDYQKCFLERKSKTLYLKWEISMLSLFLLLPLLIMLVLYPLIIIKLKLHRVPGNVNNIQAVIRRRTQNFRLTLMFIVLTVAFLLCWGPHLIVSTLIVTENTDGCIFFTFWRVSLILNIFFNAINPMIYFIFFLSFRQGFKNIFPCSCCSRTRPQAPADNFELNNINQGLHNN